MSEVRILISIVDCPPLSRTDRRNFLEGRFQQLNNQYPDLEMNFQSLSVSGQSIEALISQEKLTGVQNSLKRSGYHTHLAIDRKIV